MLASGRYEILHLLAEGGMGKVFLATDHNLDTKVVIKIPHAAMLADAEFVARFQREIRSLVKLRHRSIVSILDVGEQDGVPFAVMQFMEGKSLEDRLSNGPQSEAAIQEWLPDIAVALDFVHREGYVHRDIKPANILFDREGNAYVGDFGVIKVVGEHEARQTSKKSLTGAGMVLGTPEYMAPELVMGEPFDHRVDQYALAVTVFECLSGKRPFEGEPGAVMVKQSTAAVPSLARMCPTVSAQAMAAVNRGLAKKADARFKSCSQFASALAGRGQAETLSKATSAAATSASPTAAGTDQAHTLSCPSCGVKLRLGSRHAGKTIKCPGCKAAMKVAEDLSALSTPQADGSSSVSMASETATNAVAITASRQDLETSSTRNRLMFVIPAVLGLIVVILAVVLLRKRDSEPAPIPPVIADTSDKQEETPSAKPDLPASEPSEPSEPIAMEISSVSDQTINEGADWQLQIETTRPRPPRSRLQLAKGAPRGMYLEERSGMLTWTPAEAQGPGTFQVAVELAGVNGKTVVDTCRFNVTVNEINLPPVISAISPQVARANKPFRHGVTASDPDIPANDLRFSLNGEIPDGLRINERTGELLWDVSYRVPESSFNMKVTIADASGLSASSDFRLTVVPLLPLTVPFETDTNLIAATAALGQKLMAERSQQPEEFVNPLGARFRLIPPGEFPDGSSGVKVTEAFYIGTTEITQGQWCSLMDGEVTLGRRVAEGRISPTEAHEFCRKLGQLHGIEYRLPTEAEWEFACRAGTATEYAIPLSDQGDASTRYRHFANVKAFNRDGTALPVGVTLVRDSVLPETLLKVPNGFGLFDMHGNVSEFCQTNDKSRVVARGGSFLNGAEECTSTSRTTASEGSAGLRLVAIPNAKTQSMENISSDGHRPVPTELQNSVGMEFVLLNAGQFRMGAPDSERSAGREEKPQHVVEISQPFYMGRFEVSQAIYARVMNKKKVQREGSWRFATTEPSAFSRDGHLSASIKSLADEDVGNLPVESITWQEANEFCQELNKLIPEKNKNRTYRLPTEAEWEYACRAGTDTAFSFGDILNGADANVDGNSPYEVSCNGPFQQRTEVVGRSGPANAFGLFDMHGNVWEWCQDFYSDDYYAQSPKQNPTGPPAGTARVLRGGAWNSRPEEARSASRRSGNIDLAGPFYGLRVVLEVSR